MSGRDFTGPIRSWLVNTRNLCWPAVLPVFFCPYGALLKVGATFSKWRVRVTPNHCTQCRLCEASCPLGALREPRTIETDPLSLQTDRRRLTRLVLALPILIVAGVFVGEKVSGTAAAVHPTVALAQRWVAEQ